LIGPAGAWPGGGKSKRDLKDFLHLNALLWERKLSGKDAFNRGTLIG